MEHMEEYLKLGSELARRIESINQRLNSFDHEALQCLQVAMMDAEMYLRGLELLTFLEELREPESEFVSS